MNYGNVVKQSRKMMKQNQIEFGKSIGICQTYVCQLEKNVKKPSIDVLESIAKHTNIPLPTLLVWGLQPTSP